MDVAPVSSLCASLLAILSTLSTLVFSELAEPIIIVVVGATGR